MKRLSTFLLALLLTWIGANAQIASGTAYVIVNKEADQFLYGSYNWGCEASIGSKPVTFTVTGSGSNTYTLKANQWTGDHYVGADFYTDKSSSDAGSISITAVTEDEGYYYLSNASGAYLIGNGKNKYTTVTADADLSSDAAKWKFVTEEEIISSMTSASSENPVDVSILISNPNFRPDGNGVTTASNWTTSNVTVGSYNNNYVQANAAEAYSKETFSISQSVSLPQKGYYTLSAQGFYRNGADGNGTNTVSAQMYAGSATMDLPARRTTANTMADAWDVFLQGKEPVEPIFINASDAEESVEIGFTGEVPNSSWAIFGELTLMYYGETLTYAIGEPECSATTVKPGGTVTITFPNCITPKYSDGEAPTLSNTANITVNEETVTDATLSYSGTTATVTFTVPEDIGYGKTVTVVVPAGLVEWSGQSVSSSEATFTLSTPLFSEEQISGKFLKNLYNNDLMSRGKDYGTRADVDFIGIPLAFVLNDEGKYIIRYADADLDAASSNYLYGTNWAWADGNTSNATTFTVEEVSDEDTGELLGYHFISDLGYLYRYDATAIGASDTDDDYALAVNGVKGDNFSDDNQAIWTFVDIEERDAIKAQWVSDQKVAVAAEAGITVTNGDDFDKYVASLTEEKIVENEISSTNAGEWTGVDSEKFTTEGVESYQTATRLTRSFDSLEPGIYKITLNGFDRNSDNAYSWEMYQNGYTDLSESYIYANGYEINLKAWGSEATLSGTTYTPNGMSDASTMFGNGSYRNTLYTYVDAEGKLDIQIALLVTEYFGWAQVKNFSLYKLDQTETEIPWTMTDAGYGTLILPFEADLSSDEAYSGLTAYTIASVTTDDTNDDIAATLSLTDAGSTIEANTPYIMGGEEGEYTFKGTPTNTQNRYNSTAVSGVSLTGTLVDMDYSDFTPDVGQYVLQNHEEGGLAFYPIVSELSSEVTLDAYHCYLTYSGTSPVRGFISFPNTDGEATGIVAVEGAEAEGNGAIYDLSGRKVSKAVKGVYIQNGKKVLVK